MERFPNLSLKASREGRTGVFQAHGPSQLRQKTRRSPMYPWSCKQFGVMGPRLRLWTVKI